MATKTITIEDAATLGAFFFSADLDGVDYLLDFQFNSRESLWYVDISDLEGNPIRTGIKVVSNFPIMRLCKAAVRPAGELMFLDTTDEPIDPGLEDLGIRAICAYEEEDTLP